MRPPWLPGSFVSSSALASGWLFEMAPQIVCSSSVGAQEATIYGLAAAVLMVFVGVITMISCACCRKSRNDGAWSKFSSLADDAVPPPPMPPDSPPSNAKDAEKKRNAIKGMRVENKKEKGNQKLVEKPTANGQPKNRDDKRQRSPPSKPAPAPQPQLTQSKRDQMAPNPMNGIAGAPRSGEHLYDRSGRCLAAVSNVYEAPQLKVCEQITNADNAQQNQQLQAQKTNRMEKKNDGGNRMVQNQEPELVASPKLFTVDVVKVTGEGEQKIDPQREVKKNLDVLLLESRVM